MINEVTKKIMKIIEHVLLSFNFLVLTEVICNVNVLYEYNFLYNISRSRAPVCDGYDGEQDCV